MKNQLQPLLVPPRRGLVLRTSRYNQSDSPLAPKGQGLITREWGGGLPPRTFKFLAEHSIIVLISVLGIISLISSYDFITQPAPFDPIFIDTMHLANIVMGIKGKGF